MKREIKRYLELLEAGLALLQSLAAELESCRTAYVTLDLQGIQQSITEQENLCTQIRYLDGETLGLQQRCGEDLARIVSAPERTPPDENDAPEVSARLRTMQARMTAARAEARRLNQVHAALLRRSRRSINVLNSVLASYMDTYPEPQAVLSAQPARFGRS